MTRRVEIFRTVWNGIAIEIRWEPCWLNLTSSGFDTGHLEIRSVAPERAPLPASVLSASIRDSAPHGAAMKPTRSAGAIDLENEPM